MSDPRAGAVHPPSDLEIRFDPDAPAPNWEEAFGRRAPLVVEIGTGNGVFLASHAPRHPEFDFIGIERSGEFFTKCKKRLAREGVANARCVCADAGDVLESWFAPGSLRQIISNFSDPWPKRRHAARRVFSPPFFSLMERLLEPGGAVAYKTDVGWYFNLTVTQFRRRPGWSFTEIGPAEREPDSGGVVTNFERKAREAGSRLWGFTARWDPPAN